jgi:hypothetical protein
VTAFADIAKAAAAAIVRPVLNRWPNFRELLLQDHDVNRYAVPFISVGFRKVR